jgi:hypothetical protein
MHIEAIPNSYGYDSATEMGGRGVPQWYGSAEEFTSLEAEYFEAQGEFTKSDLQSMINTLRGIIDELEDDGSEYEGDSVEADIYEEIVGELMELEDQMEASMSLMAAEFVDDAPPMTRVDDLETLSNGYGEGTADGSGHGVPQWYGSAETFEALGEPDAAYDQGYDDQLDESLGMRDGPESSKMQSWKDRRDESKGMEKAMGNRPYSSVHTMDAEGTGGSSLFTKLAFLVGGAVIGGLTAHTLAGKDNGDTESDANGDSNGNGNGNGNNQSA